MTGTTRRRLAALSLLAWPPLALSWAIIWPDNPEDTVADFTSAAAHNGAWQLAASLFAVSFLFAIPALVATLGLVEGRLGERLATVGALLAIAGFIGDIVAGMFSVLMGVLANQPDQAAMIKVWDAFGATPGAIFFVILILLGHLGLILLCFGLWRARLVGWWVPAVMTAGMLVETVVGTAGKGEIAVTALVGGAFIGVARALWVASKTTVSVASTPAYSPA
jgi:hypothetical protein